MRNTTSLGKAFRRGGICLGSCKIHRISRFNLKDGGKDGSK